MRTVPVTLVGVVTVIASAALAAACSDPVVDDAIAALGPEDPGGPGPEHRPGQPCVLCHSKGGPASSKAFAVAGTVYQTPTGTDGADQVTVEFVDANGTGPRANPTTGPSGNFWVPIEDWENLAFPIRVGLYDDADKPPTQQMVSLIGREGSCNFCHRPLPSGDLSKAQIDQTRSSAGQIYFGSGGGGAAAPPAASGSAAPAPAADAGSSNP
jgi:hypothetical protein